MPPSFPGFVVRRNCPDPAAVRRVQARLVALGCGPLAADGLFGRETERAVRTFQARFPDALGLPLLVDGEVGPVTWAALFGEAGAAAAGNGARTRAGDAAAPAATAASGSLAADALARAAGEVGVSEAPPGSNRGARVEEFQRAAGCPPGSAWCAAFVYWCVAGAAAASGRANPLPRTGGVLEMWRRGRAAGLPSLTAAEAVARPGAVLPGMLFVQDHGGGKGHIGFVEGFDAASGRLVTVEGNANDGGSREGTGVFRLRRRTVGSANAGFLGLP